MGRVAGRLACYYWMSKRTGLRVGWFFPSKKEAVKWKNNKYYTFVESPTLEEHLDKHSLSRAVREEEIWTRHKESFEDLVIRKGVILL